MSKIKVLTIGHSYVVDSNRSVAKSIQKSGEIDLHIVSPEMMKGNLREVAVERDSYELKNFKKIPGRLSRMIHLFHYRKLDALFNREKYDLIHLWEEPYIYAGYQVAKLAQKKARLIFFGRPKIW